MVFENYESGQFRPEFEPSQDDFEAFFSSPLMQERCHVSVEIEKPAAMLLERPAIKFFGDRFSDHRFRQAFGHATRHVMEVVLGYELDQTAVRIPKGVYVTRGARYRTGTNRKKLPS